MKDRAGAARDAGLYAGSALVALAVPFTTEAPLDLEWARVAAAGYAAGAIVAWALSRRGASLRARWWVAAAVFAAVAVGPLIAHAGARAGGDGPVAVKSDVLVVEDAAAALLGGRNPYVVTYDDGAIAAWPEATKEHFPYLAGTLMFGAPRAIVGPAAWTDPRIVALAVALAVTASSLARSAARPGGRLLAFQVLLVLASGAPLVFTSGKEVPVLALTLWSLVALDRGRFVVAGVAAGLAAAAHQLAWAGLPLLAIAAPDRVSRRVAIAAATVTMLGVVAPFLLLDARAFIADAVTYPLGFGQSDDGSSFTPGSALTALVPGTRPWLVAGLWVALPLAIVALIRRYPHPTSADVARGAGVVLLTALLLAPRVRLAYFAFPLNLLVWSRFVLDRGDRVLSATPPARAAEDGVRRGQAERGAHEEASAPHRVREGVGLAGQPDVEDQHDQEERRVAAGDRPEQPAPRASVSAPARPAMRSRRRATDGDGHHRDERRVGGDERGDHGFRHRPSAP
jgi:hypothetical protein